MGAGLGERDLSRRLQHRKRLEAPGELSRPTRIDEPELRADLAPGGGAAIERTLCHNVCEACLGLRGTQCVEDPALGLMSRTHDRACIVQRHLWVQGRAGQTYDSL